MCTSHLWHVASSLIGWSQDNISGVLGILINRFCREAVTLFAIRETVVNTVVSGNVVVNYIQKVKRSLKKYLPLH